MSSLSTAEPAEKAKYEVGELALASHYGKLYVAKILSVDYDEVVKKYKYKIHYQNWSSKWDEYVEDDRLCKDNSANRLKKEQKDNESKKKRETVTKKSSSSRSKIDERSIQIKLELPYEIKKCLTEDWNCIVNKNLRIPLPRTPTIKTIFDKYIESCKAGEEKKDAKELCKGLTDYFNLCFSRILFYEKEESQFKKALDAISIEDPCEIYGVEHLCRLFAKLPYLFSLSNITDLELTTISSALSSFYSFLKNHPEYFLAPADYVEEDASITSV